ncbi:hypothetical protein ADU59_09855 [Pararhizobium polonicum]|uniref:EamA domain-containing protein n=1 Tax=Pararhizobium polonicum TaxID=1612624 RepID=A0A1C7P354_9HYPH|nr:EamA family transporter [Pararhizobium polonicum]OBZ95667.1 hypothetical protein ADU59_09855 [Pararhizobium polonicum]
MPAPQTHHAFAVLSVFAALSCSALGAAYAKSLFPMIGPEGVTAFRVGVAALLLAPIGRPWRRRLPDVSLTSVIGYGIALGLMNILIYQAFSRLPLGIAMGIEVLGPLMVALIYSKSRLDLIWVASAFVGLFLLLPIAVSSDLDPLGLLFAGGAAICWACYILLGRMVAPLGPTQAVSLGMAVAATFAVPFGIYGSIGTFLDGKVIAIGVSVAILSSAIPYLLEMFAFRHLSSGVAGIFLSAAPGIVAVIGLLVLGERLTSSQVLSLVLIMGATAGCAIFSGRPHQI